MRTRLVAAALTGLSIHIGARAAPAGTPPLGFLGSRILSARRVTASPDVLKKIHDGHPIVSEDGKTLAFTSGSDVSSAVDLYLSDANGSDARRVYQPFLHPSPIQFTRGSRYLLVRGEWMPDPEPGPDTWDIWRAGPKNGVKASETGIWRFDLRNGPKPHNDSITRVSPWSVTASDWQPSPDGKHVAYAVEASSGADSGAGVYIADADGHEPRRIGAGYAPRWSLDGRILACIRTVSVPLRFEGQDTRTADATELWLADADGSHNRRVLSPARVYPDRTLSRIPATFGAPVWIDDASFLIAVSRHPNWSVEWYDIKGRKLGSQPGLIFVGASANGRWILTGASDSDAVWLVHLKQEDGDAKPGQ